MKAYFSLDELLAMGLEGQPESIQGWYYKAKKGSWQFREVPCKGGRGGKKREYLPPPEIRDAILHQQQVRALAEVPSASTVLPPAVGADTEMLMQVYGSCTQQRRDQADARAGVVRNVLDSMEATGRSMAQVVTTMLTLAAHPDYPHLYRMLVLANDKRGGGGEIPSSRTVMRWVEKAKNAGGGRLEMAMVARVREKAVQAPDWVPVFITRYYQTPQKPSVPAAFEWFLRDWQAGSLALAPFSDTADYPNVHQARRWVDKMGAVSKQRGRMGARELKTRQGFVRRRWQDYLPLDIVVADGQCFDAECGHPDNPNVPIRPEITLIVDVGTRRIVGVGMDTAESGRAVRGAVAEMVLRHGCAAVFNADNGKGYANGLLQDEVTGLFARLGTTMKFSAPYSSQARGVIERLHKTVLVKLSKRLNSYIGADMDGEASRAAHKVARKAMKMGVDLQSLPALKNIASLSPRLLPTFEEMKRLVYAAVEEYNDTPHRSMEKVRDVSGAVRHQTPNELWAVKAALAENSPDRRDRFVKIESEEQMFLFLPQEIRTVQRSEVSLRNNRYYSPLLEEYHQQQVRIAYNEHNADRVWVLDMDGRFIAAADWDANARDFYPKAVVEQAKDKRLQGQINRLDYKKAVIQETRPSLLVEHQDTRVNIGGVVFDMAEVKAKAAALSQHRSRVDDVTVETVEVKAVKRPSETEAVTGWSVPSEASERFALYQRICGQTDLPPQAQRWLERYPQSNEYKALSRRVMTA